ncbi:unnamed protein product, partial [Brugia timori]|uniref:RNA polymerase II subunit A C-terminal domain phosphatase SSU72 n=1 Tax=Brugia timori TaxID=42155 RepID=A0A0R3Q845_9BILA
MEKYSSSSIAFHNSVPAGSYTRHYIGTSQNRVVKENIRVVTSMGKLRFAVSCSSNMNRSMEAHSFLQMPQKKECCKDHHNDTLKERMTYMWNFDISTFFIFR